VDELTQLFVQAMEDDDLVQSNGDRRESFLKFCREELGMRPFQVCDRLVLLGCDIRDYVPKWLVGYYQKSS